MKVLKWKYGSESVKVKVLNWTWGTKLSQREAACPRKFLLHRGFRSGRSGELLRQWYHKIKVIISSSYHHHIIIISSSNLRHKNTYLKVAFLLTKLLPVDHLEPLVSISTWTLPINKFVLCICILCLYLVFVFSIYILYLATILNLLSVFPLEPCWSKKCTLYL